MKEIRQINKVVSPQFEACDNEEYNETEIKKLLGIFDSEPAYFQQVIRPMLSPGHENELVFWLKELGLIKSIQKCKNAMVNEKCSPLMLWTTSRVNDMYQWKCSGCSGRQSIRTNSVFHNIRCSFKDAIRIILGWCKGTDIDSLAVMLGVRKTVVGSLYKKSALIAEKFMKDNISEWQVGGPGCIVLIDTYPEGCANQNQRREGRPILCISEVKSFPQKYWLETLSTIRRQNTEQVISIKEHILETIQRIVIPGSILVTPSESIFCSYEDIICLKNLYPTIVTTDLLSRHDNDQQNLLSNLEIIWKSLLDICEEAQYYSLDYIQEFILGNLWRRRYGSTSFEMLVYQIGV